jgi:hypothetical protein
VSIGGANGLTVTVGDKGSYTIVAPGLNWRFAGTLGAAAANVQVASGADAIGTYSEIAFDFWTDAARHGSIRTYWDHSVVLFTASQPAGAANTFTFPNLSEHPQGLNHLAYSGTFAPPSFWYLAPESPWVFFDGASNAFILSPATNFMAAANSRGANGELQSGIAAEIKTLPAGFEHRTMLVIEKGINRAFDTWGQSLLTLSGKQRPANDADPSLNKAGYWTDNGATYYYRMAGTMSYEQTLRAVKTDFDKLGIGLGYVQLDSWFYPKGPQAAWNGNGQGIYQYMGDSALFSAGLSRFQQSLGVPLITHARWIDESSPYRKSYQMSGNVVLSREYWDSVASYLANSGVATYEQDWLNDKAQPAFNLTDADTFLSNMAASMASRGLTMQYCMASPRHFLQSTLYGNLTTIRTSADRLSRDKWSDFLYTSRLASAAGAWPFTDNFLSTETTHMLMAALSAGPVGIGDALGAINGANLLRAVRRDGVIVKPDMPMTPIDRSYTDMARGTDTPQIAEAYSDFGSERTRYIFAYTKGTNPQVHLQPLEIGASKPVYLYDYFSGKGQVMDAADSIDRQISGDALYLVMAPVGPSGMAIVGDVEQFVTMGKKRVAAYTDDGRVHMTIAFANGEQSRVITGYSPFAPSAHALDGVAGQPVYDATTHLFRLRVSPGPSGSATVRIGRSHGKVTPTASALQ